MRDIEAFLGWYLGARTKMGRGLFNGVIFVAMLPVLLIQMNDMAAGVSNKSSQLAPIMGLMQDATSGRNHFDATDVEGVLDYTDKSAGAVRGAMRSMGFADDFSYHENKPKDKGFDLAELVNLLIYILLIPVVMMRLRDLAVWENKLYIYTGLTYVGMACDSAKDFLGFDVSTTVSMMAGAVSFFMLTFLCMAKSKTVNRQMSADTYMPGDSPDDPY